VNSNSVVSQALILFDNDTNVTYHYQLLKFNINVFAISYNATTPSFKNTLRLSMNHKLTNYQVWKRISITHLFFLELHRHYCELQIAWLHWTLQIHLLKQPLTHKPLKSMYYSNHVFWKNLSFVALQHHYKQEAAHLASLLLPLIVFVST
jgi:hypothetical protein